MNLLFIQQGARVRETTNGKFYVDTSFNNNIWKRYNQYCDKLTVILRKVAGKFEEEELRNKYNWIDTDLVNLVLVDDVFLPKKNFFNMKIRRKINLTIKNEVIKTDKVILRSAGDFYTNIAYKYCKKYHKVFLIESIGFPLKSFWYHSMFGKFISGIIDYRCKKAIYNAPYVVYVTNKALQKKYPTNGKNIGCSDIEIKIDKDINKKKIDESKIIIGTAASLNTKIKGQKDVLKALNILKKQNLNNFEYQLVGTGDSSYLKKFIIKYNLADNVKILGPLAHDKVFGWLDNIDIYIQPSYNEGLSRSIIEAMSRKCAVICTDVGGNTELIDTEFTYKKGKSKELAKILKKYNTKRIEEQGEKNYNKSKKYDEAKLKYKRDKFYLEFESDGGID